MAETSRLPRWVHWVLFALLMAGGLTVRMYDITDAPLEFHATRQLHSAIITRGMYYQMLGSAADTNMAARAILFQKLEGKIEPQVMETITARVWLWMGDTPLWVPRLFAITSWMAGAVAIWLLSRKLGGSAGGLVGLAVFLFVPYTIMASRVFQPDPLAVALMAWALWAFWRWAEKPGWANAAVAGLLLGLAVYIKTPVGFLLAGGMIGIVMTTLGWRTMFRQRSLWLLVTLAVLPYAAYFIDGMWVSGFLKGQTALRFFPQYWLDPAFYLRWVNLLAGMAGWLTILIGILGVLLAPGRTHRAVLIGIWLGYLLSGFALSHHISTHDYYSLPLFVPIALGFAVLGGWVWDSLGSQPRWTKWAVIGLFLVAAAFPAWQVRSDLKRINYRTEAALWEDLGERLGGPDASVVALSEDYGARLKYWAWINPRNWPTVDDIQLRQSVGQVVAFEELATELTIGADVFLITLPDEFKRQPDLQKWLDNNYSLIEKTDRYWLYDLRQKSTP